MGVQIRSVEIRFIQNQTGRLGRKETEKAIVIKTTGGDVILPRSTVETAGDSWEKLAGQLSGASL